MTFKSIFAFGFVIALTGALVRASMPSVDDLPVHTEMPDPLVSNDGQKVSTVEQWRQRREEMKQILEEYEFGHMPPAPGNVMGREVQSRKLNDGAVSFRQVHLTFG